MDWYFGLGVEGAPDSITDFLGGAGTESPGYDGYPATKAQLLAAARESISDLEEPNLADLDWLSERLPEGTYRDAGDVFSVLQGPIMMPRADASPWMWRSRIGAIPLGARLVVPSDGRALLVGRGGRALDTFGPGEHRLTRASAPLAAAQSRPPPPDASRGILESSVVFFSTREQEGAVSFSGRTKSAEPMFVTARVRFSLSDPGRFVESPTGKSYSEALPPDRLLSSVVTPELKLAVQSHEGRSLSSDPALVEGTIRTALESSGLSAGSVRLEYLGSSPVGILSARGGTDPFAQMPPEVRAMMQARMEEAMRHRPSGSGSVGRPGLASAPSAAADPRVDGSAPSSPTGTVVCSACHATNPASGKFCHGCGAPLTTKRSCPACGQEAGASVKFCGQCGARLP